MFLLNSTIPHPFILIINWLPCQRSLEQTQGQIFPLIYVASVVALDLYYQWLSIRLYVGNEDELNVLILLEKLELLNIERHIIPSTLEKICYPGMFLQIQFPTQEASFYDFVAYTLNFEKWETVSIYNTNFTNYLNTNVRHRLEQSAAI